jgi:hypothetical protein
MVSQTTHRRYLADPRLTTQDGPFKVASFPVEALAAPSVQKASRREMRGVSHAALALGWEGEECCEVVGVIMGTKTRFAAKPLC